jgi:hypothetical protein
MLSKEIKKQSSTKSNGELILPIKRAIIKRMVPIYHLLLELLPKLWSPYYNTTVNSNIGSITNTHPCTIYSRKPNRTRSVKRLQEIEITLRSIPPKAPLAHRLLFEAYRPKRKMRDESGYRVPKRRIPGQ